MRQLNFPFPKWMAMFTMAVFLFAVFSVTTAQGEEDGSDLEETLKRLSNDAAQSYVSPVVSAFGSNLNAGWYHKTPPAKMFGLDLEFGLKVMGTFFPEEEEYRHFSTSGQFRFNNEQARRLVSNVSLPSELVPFQDQLENALIDAITDMDIYVGISGATIIGESDDYIKIEFRGEDIVVSNPLFGLPGEPETITLEVPQNLITLEGVGGLGDYLADISFLPFVAPQIGVGTILGTRATFRYIPEIEIPLVEITEDIGTFSWFGYGIQHNPGVFFPTPLPVDISAGFFKQTLKLGNVFEANTTAYGVNVSKKLGIRIFNITPYAGFMFEKSTLKFTYDFMVDETKIPVAFELEGENTSRLTLGLSLRLLLFNLNADYNMGKYNSISVGVMFAL